MFPESTPRQSLHQKVDRGQRTMQIVCGSFTISSISPRTGVSYLNGNVPCFESIADIIADSWSLIADRWSRCWPVWRNKHACYKALPIRIDKREQTWPSFLFTCLTISKPKLVVSRNYLSIRIVLRCFHVLILYFKNFSTWSLTFAVCRIREAFRPGSDAELFMSRT